MDLNSKPNRKKPCLLSLCWIPKIPKLETLWFQYPAILNHDMRNMGIGRTCAIVWLGQRLVSHRPTKFVAQFDGDKNRAWIQKSGHWKHFLLSFPCGKKKVRLWKFGSFYYVSLLKSTKISSQKWWEKKKKKKQEPRDVARPECVAAGPPVCPAGGSCNKMRTSHMLMIWWQYSCSL